MILIPLAILELIKRPIFWLLYPFAYYFRADVRTATRKLWLAKTLWLALDDSIYKESGREYCEYSKRSALVEKLPESAFKEFARSFYWGAWRNNGINAMILQENFVGEVRNSLYLRYFRRSGDYPPRESFYSLRYFPRRGLALPYIQLWFGGWRFQAGFLTCGRWQIQFRKLSP